MTAIYEQELMLQTQTLNTLATTHFILFFSECTVSANGVKNSNMKGNYEHKAFIETDFSSGKLKKNMASLSEILLRR